MKNFYLKFSVLFVTLLFMSSCQMSMDGNLISLKNNAGYYSDTLDSYNFSIPRIKQLYLHANEYGGEYVDIIYNNGYAKTYRVTKKDISTDYIDYILDNEKNLYFRKSGNEIRVLFKSNKWIEFRNTDYYRYHQEQYYTVSSVSYSKESPKLNTPSFNDIQSYKKRGEVKGNVKSVSYSIYDRLNMFGEDTLSFLKSYIAQYDCNGNLIYVTHKDKNNRESSYSCKYDEKGNIVSERKGNISIKYDECDNEFKQTILCYSNNNKVAHRDITYDSNMKLKECDYYRHYLDRKIKYKKNTYDNCIYGYVYDDNGMELYKNKYDINYSIIDGRIDLGDYGEFLNPFESYGCIDTKRDCNVTNDDYNTTIKIKYPYGIISKYTSEILEESMTYNANYNIVRKEVVEATNNGRYETKTKDKYIMVYKYDLQGNWIERHSILTSHDVDGKIEVCQSRGFIEYRNIEYYDNN